MFTPATIQLVTKPCTEQESAHSLYMACALCTALWSVTLARLAWQSQLAKFSMALLNFYYYVNECFRYNLANDIARAGEDSQHKEERKDWSLSLHAFQWLSASCSLYCSFLALSGEPFAECCAQCLYPMPISGKCCAYNHLILITLCWREKVSAVPIY